MKRMLALLAILLMTGSALASQAGAEQGNGQLVGRSVFAIKGCGSDRSTFDVTIATKTDGTWSALNPGGDHFSGAWTGRGRNLKVAFDTDSEVGFVSRLVNTIAVRCNTSGPITVNSIVKKEFRLTVNPKRTHATLVLRYVVKGSADGRSGTGRYTAKAQGPWTPQTFWDFNGALTENTCWLILESPVVRTFEIAHHGNQVVATPQDTEFQNVTLTGTSDSNGFTVTGTLPDSPKSMTLSSSALGATVRYDSRAGTDQACHVTYSGTLTNCDVACCPLPPGQTGCK